MQTSVSAAISGWRAKTKNVSKKTRRFYIFEETQRLAKCARMRPSKANAHAAKVDKRQKQTFAQHRNWHPQVRKDTPVNLPTPAQTTQAREYVVVACGEDEKKEKWAN